MARLLKVSDDVSKDSKHLSTYFHSFITIICLFILIYNKLSIDPVLSSYLKPCNTTFAQKVFWNSDPKQILIKKYWHACISTINNDVNNFTNLDIKILITANHEHWIQC